MQLTPGTRFGPYEIVAPLGAGGMGEVYRARDTRLDRTVALKVLPQHVLSDPALRARFEREARTLSSLDHPSICTLFDVGREGDVEYLVMQYLDGETLAARLGRGPLPLDEALRYAVDIAAALDRAHRAGVLHRDIKPGNVMLARTAGRDTAAKLLDFGLAKTLETGTLGVTEAVEQTATSPLTGRGTIVGTMLYMSPEQLEGRDLDGRSDIFSFGAVLYEMITRRRAFEGGSQASVIGAILERDPPPMASAVPLTPPALDRAVRKCLAKDRERRWQSAADLCDELSWIAQSSGLREQPLVPQPPPRRRWKIPLIAAAAALLAIAAAGAFGLLTRPRADAADPVPRDLEITLPAGLTLSRGGVVVSPDGRSIVFVATPAPAAPEDPSAEPRRSAPRLYLRRFDSADVTPLAGTLGARTPFFSPDGLSVGYFTTRALLKVAIRGGAPVRVIGTPPVTRGGAWLPDDSIVVAPTQTAALVRVSADGKSQPFTTLDVALGERAHLWPQAMPGGRQILFTIRRGTTTDMESADVGIVDVATGDRRILLKGAAFAQYSPSGHLLFVRGGTLFAVPMDPTAKEIRGTPTPIAANMATDPWVGGAHYAVASDATVLCLRGAFPEATSVPVWVDRAGATTPAAGITTALPGQPRISPDGTRAVFNGQSPDGDDEIYVADLVRGTAVRLSLDPQDDFNPVWSADGSRVIWTALPPGRLPFLVMRSADGSGTTEELLREPSAQFAGSVSPSGLLAYTQASQTGTRDIFVVPLNGPRKATPFITTAASEYGPQFSPDGKWLAYVSDESGAREVYVAPYPGPGGYRRVSTGGGVSPAWSRDGRELFYQVPGALMAVDVTPGATIQFGTPRRAFGGPFLIDSREDGPRAYDVSPDGKRFLMLVERYSAVPPPVFHVLIDWRTQLTGGRK